jgi:hypothetical protein
VRGETERSTCNYQQTRVSYPSPRGICARIGTNGYFDFESFEAHHNQV